MLEIIGSIIVGLGLCTMAAIGGSKAHILPAVFLGIFFLAVVFIGGIIFISSLGI